MLFVFRRLLLLGFCVLGSLSAPAWALKVGISAQYPPLAYEQEGRIVGIEPDNANAVGKIIGRKLELVPMPFTHLIPALVAGEIDIVMSGMSVTADRSAQVSFTNPFLEVGQVGIVHIDKVAAFLRPWSLQAKGVRVAVQPGTTGALYVERELPDAKIKFYTESAAAFAGLRKDEVDLYIHDAPTSWLLATTRDGDDLISLNTALTEESLAWAVRKEDVRLLAMLNDALASMQASGTARYILNRWIPVGIKSR